MARNDTKEPVTITPKALAEELEVSPKALRAYLRSNFPRVAEAKNSAWQIDEEVAEAVREHYSESEDSEDEE
jgi:predicted transcriptional regulator